MKWFTFMTIFTNPPFFVNQELGRKCTAIIIAAAQAASIPLFMASKPFPV